MPEACFQHDPRRLRRLPQGIWTKKKHGAGRGTAKPLARPVSAH